MISDRLSRLSIDSKLPLAKVHGSRRANRGLRKAQAQLVAHQPRFALCATSWIKALSLAMCLIVALGRARLSMDFLIRTPGHLMELAAVLASRSNVIH